MKLVEAQNRPIVVEIPVDDFKLTRFRLDSEKTSWKLQLVAVLLFISRQVRSSTRLSSSDVLDARYHGEQTQSTPLTPPLLTPFSSTLLETHWIKNVNQLLDMYSGEIYFFVPHSALHTLPRLFPSMAFSSPHRPVLFVPRSEEILCFASSGEFFRFLLDSHVKSTPHGWRQEKGFCCFMCHLMAVRREKASWLMIRLLTKTSRIRVLVLIVAFCSVIDFFASQNSSSVASRRLFSIKGCAGNNCHGAQSAQTLKFLISSSLLSFIARRISDGIRGFSPSHHYITLTSICWEWAQRALA
jgi:hypothetical protein